MNKKTKTIVIALIVIVLIAVIYFLIPKQPGVNVTPEQTTTTTEVANIGPVDCADDYNCLATNLLSCKPAELKMDFTPPGSKYVITVLGEEAGNCHYETKVLDADGNITTGLDCKVPLASISEDTFQNLFGQDIGSARETQAQLESTYCTALQ